LIVLLHDIFDLILVNNSLLLGGSQCFAYVGSLPSAFGWVPQTRAWLVRRNLWGVEVASNSFPRFMQSVVPSFSLFLRFGRFRTEQCIGTPQFGFRELSSHQNVVYSASSLGAI
jgi:hypothetical protein